MFWAVKYGRDLVGSVPERLSEGRSIALDAFWTIFHERLGAIVFRHESKSAGKR
jgi:hypothetical protein